MLVDVEDSKVPMIMKPVKVYATIKCYSTFYTVDNGKNVKAIEYKDKKYKLERNKKMIRRK